MPKFQQISQSRKLARKILENNYTKLAITILSFIYTIMVFISLTFEDLMEPREAERAQVNFSYIEFLILVIFLLEMGLGVYSLRLKGYFKDPWLLVDAMVITFSMGFVIYDIIEANSNAKAISPITKVIRAIFRFLRLFLLMRKSQNIKRIKTNSTIITYAERITDFLVDLKWSITDENDALDLDWCIDRISRNKIYEIKMDDHSREAANWIGYQQKKTNIDKPKGSNKGNKRFTIRKSIFPDNFSHNFQAGKTISVNARQALGDVDSINFNVFQFSQVVPDEELSQLVIYLFETNELLSELNINAAVLATFISAVEAGYKLNPYHNRLHACDVTQTVNFMVKGCSFGTQAELSAWELAGMYIAAAIHDYGHPGVNNAFLIKRRSQLAMVYNGCKVIFICKTCLDKGVLENYHVSASFFISKSAKADIFSTFSHNQYQKIRSSIISMVLATDMAVHFGDIARLNEGFDAKKGEKQMLMDSIVHGADISNPLKQFEVCKQWAERILEELWSQGDQERELGDPVSYLCDKYTTNTAKSQIGFIELIVKPLFDVLSIAVPGLKAYVDCLTQNKSKWQGLVIEYDDKLSMPHTLPSHFIGELNEELERTRINDSKLLPNY